MQIPLPAVTIVMGLIPNIIANCAHKNTLVSSSWLLSNVAIQANKRSDKFGVILLMQEKNGAFIMVVLSYELPIHPLSIAYPDGML